MSTRISLFDIRNIDKLGMQPFLKGMALEKFSASQAAGFLVDRESSRQVEGRYVQKISTTETFDDPFGKKYSYERVFFTEQKFLLRLKSPNLVLFNSNSAGKILTGRLSDFSNFTMALEALTWSPEELLVQFAKQFPPVRVFAATVDEIKLCPTAAVSLFFESSDDVLPHARKFLKKKKPPFESLKLEFTYLESVRRCELRNNGGIQIYGDPDLAVTSAILELVDRFIARKTSKPSA